MHLQSLCPKEGASLVQLKALLEGRGWRSALPTSLPDTVLLRLARDFRTVERSFTTEDHEDGEQPSLASAIYVTMNLLLQHPSHSMPATEIKLSEAGMMKALQMYQWGVEREVVGRIVGLPRADVMDSLLDGLWRCLHE